MDTLKKNWAFLAIGLVSLLLGSIALLTALRLRQETPVAPTAPTQQQALEGIPVPACNLNFVVLVASPAPTVSPTVPPTAAPTITPTATPSATLTPTPSPIPSPPTATPQPSPIPTPMAQCTAVRLYSVVGNINTAANWHLLTAAEIQNLRAGDIIYLTTTGTVANGPTITQARIQVALNNAAFAPWIQAQHNTTSIRAGSSPVEYYLPYTIPSNIYTFTVGAEVYSQQFDTTPTSAWDNNSGWR